MRKARLGALIVAVAGLLGAISSAAAAPSAPRPNIIIFLADDMGFSDPGCYGGEIHTPNLDALASEGLRFTDFHNTSRCWPSRAALLTGYYAQQVRRDDVPGVASGAAGHRPKWARLLPELLKPFGYHAYHSGKWHVDGPRLAAGFEHSYSLDDHNRYFSPQEHYQDDRMLPEVERGSGYYSTTAIASHAIEFLDGHARKHPVDPFFLYVAFTSPHYPLHALPQDIAKYAGKYDQGWDAMRKARWRRLRELGIVDCALPPLEPDIIPAWNFPEAKLRRMIGPGEVGRALPWDQLSSVQQRFQAVKMSLHAAMVDRMDQEIGRVLQKLDLLGKREDTIVLFLSDNGASAEQIIRGDGHDRTAAPGSAGTFLSIGPGWSSACNTPLRLHKSWVHEGGMSTPLIVRWPKGIAARGELRRNPSHLIDIVPTLLDLAGGAWPPHDATAHAPSPPGKSLRPVFDRDNTVSHDYFWWFHEGHQAIRVGDWKLVARGMDEPWELYDVLHDRSELTDRAPDYPDKVRELAALWHQHLSEFTAEAAEDAPALPAPTPEAANEAEHHD